MNNLFEKGKSIHEESRRPDRPFEAFSSYVVETMPQVLDSIRTGRASVDELISAAEARIPFYRMSVFANPMARDLAGLDAKMLEAAIVHSGGVPKRKLATFVDDLARATGMKAGVTYEDLIFVNPLKSDPRLFTTGEVGLAERDFYLGHRLLEDPLSGAVQRCKDAVTVLQTRGKQGIVKAGTLLHQAQELFIPVTTYTNHIGQNMSKENFKIFRQYLGGNPHRGIVGPSGKFTAGIPVLDFLLGGHPIIAEYPKLDEEMGYYPRGGQKEIQIARMKAQSGESLADISKGFGNPRELYEPLQEMSKAIREFRGQHMKAVGRQVPEALVNNAAGTGGEDDAGSFLRKRLRIHHIPQIKEGK